MKLTRKHLNLILTQLPHPSLAHHGKMNRVIQVPVCEPMQVIHPDINHMDKYQDLHILTFEYSHEEMDWVLKELNV